MAKILVAYFSASGVTKRAAEKVAQAANADLYEIKPETPYTDADLNWHDPKSRSSVEMNDHPELRPAIAGTVENMAQYDTILLGFPIWWYVAPTIINTFLEQYDLSGKRIVLFATSGMSGMGRTMAALKPSAPGAVFGAEKRLSANLSQAEVDQWVQSLDLQGGDQMQTITLNDGSKIPAVGFGVFMVENGGPTYDAVLAALKAGYRHIDTAAAYFNEEDVGRAVRDSGIPRKEIFITSKLWLQDYGYEGAKVGIARSLRKLGTDYIDLYLIHQPYGDVPGAWKAMEEARAAGKLRSIGVSNMTPNIWNKFVPQFATKPAVNQVECNPFFQQKALRKILAQDGVRLECYYPLGHGSAELLTHPVITRLAEKYGKNAGQIILRFEVQEGLIVLPKSTDPARIAGNLDIFDFTLAEAEMEELRGLDTGKGSHDPEAPGVEEMLRSAFVIED